MVRVDEAGSPAIAPSRWRGVDGQLLVAAVASVVFTKAVLALVRLAGGFFYYAVPVEPAWDELRHHVWITLSTIGVVFGAYPPDLHGPLAWLVGALHMVGILAVAAAVVVMSVRLLGREQPGDT